MIIYGPVWKLDAPKPGGIVIRALWHYCVARELGDRDPSCTEACSLYNFAEASLPPSFLTLLSVAKPRKVASFLHVNIFTCHHSSSLPRHVLLCVWTFRWGSCSRKDVLILSFIPPGWMSPSPTTWGKDSVFKWLDYSMVLWSRTSFQENTQDEISPRQKQIPPPRAQWMGLNLLLDVFSSTAFRVGEFDVSPSKEAQEAAWEEEEGIWEATAKTSKLRVLAGPSQLPGPWLLRWDWPSHSGHGAQDLLELVHHHRQTENAHGGPLPGISLQGLKERKSLWAHRFPPELWLKTSQGGEGTQPMQDMCGHRRVSLYLKHGTPSSIRLCTTVGWALSLLNPI